MDMLYGIPLADWNALRHAMAGHNLEPADVARWLDNEAAALIEERARADLAEAKLLRIKKLLDKE